VTRVEVTHSITTDCSDDRLANLSDSGPVFKEVIPVDIGNWNIRTVRAGVMDVIKSYILCPSSP
jgi:hypothetical protein